MAKRGAFGTISIGGSAVGQLRRISVGQEANEIDTTIMGSGNASQVPGAIRHNVEVDAFFESADAGQAAILTNLGSDTPVAIIVRPQGAGAGLVELTGNVFIMSRNLEWSADGAIELSFAATSDENGLTQGTQ